MSAINNSLLLEAPASTSYQISRSLRFNSADSAYLSRTPGSAGNRKTWTWAGWVKRTNIGAAPVDHLMTVSDGSTDSDYLRLWFNGDLLTLGGYNTTYRRTTAVYRDVSAWYHIVCSVDTTQATGANRVRIYVNGSQVTSFGVSNDPTQNADLAFNRAAAHYIGREASADLDGYLADIHFIDGQALTPSSFGEFDSNNVWQPKAYSGSYGTNGFKLDFADNSNNTAATLGKDTSGNGNNWTPNNLSVTAGSGNDSLVDSPTNYGTDTGVGGEVRGNYCTLNPLDKSTNFIPKNGNLEPSDSVGWGSARSTIAIPTSGKWYAELTMLTNGANSASNWYSYFGFSTSAFNLASAGYGQSTAAIWTDGYLASNFSATDIDTTSTNKLAGDVIGILVDRDASTFEFRHNNSTKVSGTIGGGSGQLLYFVGGVYSGTTGNYAYNFGQRPFAYTAPSGYKALCSTNLPAGTITTSGSFTGNANADGPFVSLNGVPTAMTINGNAVTFGTHADKLSNGFKLRTNSTSYNTSGSNTFSVSATGDTFNVARAQPNP